MEQEFKQFSLKMFTGKGYTLTPVEFKDMCPFEVKRMYYVTHFEPGAQTGEHCHRIEEEVFIQAQGTSIAIIDRGQGKEDVSLAEGEALYVPNYVWHGFKNPSSDCVIIALSSTNYTSDRSDYVENYDEYLTFRDDKLSVRES